MDFNFKFKDLNNEEGEIEANKLFATILINQTQGDILKLMEWARTLYKGEKITPDKADVLILEKIVNSANISIILKEQLLNAMKV